MQNISLEEVAAYACLASALSVALSVALLAAAMLARAVGSASPRPAAWLKKLG